MTCAHGPASFVPAELVPAYLATEYAVFGAPAFVLEVGTKSAALSAMMEARRTNSATVITAWNPYSSPAKPHDNDQAQRRLVEQLRVGGWACIEAEGRSTTSDWPPEQSLLVLGLRRSQATALARAYRQSAIIWCGRSAIPELLLCRGRTRLVRHGCKTAAAR